MEKMNMDNRNIIKNGTAAVKKYLDTGVTDIKFIGGGSNGKAFRATLGDGRNIVIKAFREHGAQDKEAGQLRILSANTSVEMPEVLFTHTDRETALMGMSYIKGKNVLDPLFLFKSKKQKEKFAQDVVNGLSQIHSVASTKFGELENPVYSGWVDYFCAEKQEPWLQGLKKLSEQGKFSRKKLELLQRATRIFNEICEEPENSVLIHGDLNIMNIMADPKTLELTGFIDPSGTIWADREFDLYQFLNMWGGSFGLYEKYKEVHGLSENADFRVAYYAAIHEAACRLGSGLIMPLWEDLNISRLKKLMKKY